MSYRSIIAALAAGIMLAGCGQESTPTQSNVGPSMATDASHNILGHNSPGPNLYVANDPSGGPYSITVYAKGTSRLLRKISDNVNEPTRLAFDISGNLYVASYPNNTVTVFGSGTDKVLETIRTGIDGPGRPAFDSAGNMYVPNYNSSTVAVYAPGNATPSRTISQNIYGPSVVALDSSDNLYVANAQEEEFGVAVFAAGTGNPVQTITNGVDTPVYLSFDEKGNLWVANGGPHPYDDSVTEYGSGNYSLLNTLNKGIFEPRRLAFDGSQHLVVLNRRTITAFKPGANAPYLTIHKGAPVSADIVVGSDGSVYVATGQQNGKRQGKGVVNVYAPGQVNISRRIKSGIDEPTTLEFGP